jgi:hypothetical protein
MPNVIHHFAILAPVPEEHLMSGQDVVQKTGFVAFGTRKWELLRQVDSLRDGDPVPVLIYPSHEDTPVKNSFIVSWFGWYFGHVASKGGAHPDGLTHRPQSTVQYPLDNAGHWAAFWHVRDLRELPLEKRITIGKIGTVKGGWRKDAPPRGPELVALPESLSYET